MRLAARFAPALTLISIFGGATSASGQASERDLARAKRILRETPLIDGHNDLPWRIREDSIAKGNVAAYDLRQRTAGHTDLERLRAGLIGAQFWSVYLPGDYRDSGFARVQLEQIDIARRVIERYPDRFTLALSTGDIRRSFKQGKIGSLIGMEGGHAIENSLGALRAFYDLGARYMTLTHNVTLDWADAANDSAKHNGLTSFGESVVREMNRLGMLVDLSHASPATMSDALNVTQAPVIFSHSSARALVDVPRNVPDSILRRLPANGGVVMVTFVPAFVSANVLRHENVHPANHRAAARAARQRFGRDQKRFPGVASGEPIAARDAGRGGRSHRAHQARGRRGPRRDRRRFRRDIGDGAGTRRCLHLSGAVRGARSARMVGQGSQKAGGGKRAAGVRADRSGGCAAQKGQLKKARLRATGCRLHAAGQLLRGSALKLITEFLG